MRELFLREEKLTIFVGLSHTVSASHRANPQKKRTVGDACPYRVRFGEPHFGGRGTTQWGEPALRGVLLYSTCISHPVTFGATLPIRKGLGVTLTLEDEPDLK